MAQRPVEEMKMKHLDDAHGIRTWQNVRRFRSAIVFLTAACCLFTLLTFGYYSTVAS